MSTKTWQPPSDWTKITTLESHTGGEPFRVVVSGFPELPGETVLERRRWAHENLDHLRRALMWEPRGHADMYGCLLSSPVTEEADLTILFIHNEGFSTMCGHGIIAMTTVAIETGMIEHAPNTDHSEHEVVTVRFDTPAGLVTAQGRLDGGRVREVSFQNVASFALDLDQKVEVPGWGTVSYDLAFGGAFYAYVDATRLGLRCEPSEFRRLIEAGQAIKQAVMESREIVHPFEEDLGFLYGVILIAPSEEPGVHSRNVCIFADGEVDRCPTGTGVSGRLAIHHARGEIEIHEEIVIESLIGSRFAGEVVAATTFGSHKAVIPQVTGSASITGRHEFYLDPDDPFRHGFLLR